MAARRCPQSWHTRTCSTILTHFGGMFTLGPDLPFRWVVNTEPEIILAPCGSAGGLVQGGWRAYDSALGYTRLHRIETSTFHSVSRFRANWRSRKCPNPLFSVR